MKAFTPAWKEGNSKGYYYSTDWSILK